MTTGVLLMGYGSPDSPEGIERYLCNIKAGHARPGSAARPTPEETERLRKRYAAIGGTSPFNGITAQQASALQGSLQSRGADVTVHIGMLHWEPTIASAAENLSRDEVNGILALPMTPFYSQTSIGGYRSALAATAAAGGKPAVHFAGQWHLDPAFVGVWADAIGAKMKSIGATTDDTHILFTAHSLPASILEHGDAYPTQFRELCEAIAASMGLQRWSLAFQSASGKGWLGPSVGERAADLAAERDTRIIIAPIGFVTENLETLYDIDIECVSALRQRGADIHRVGTPNASASFINALASIVIEGLESAQDNGV